MRRKYLPIEIVVAIWLFGGGGKAQAAATVQGVADETVYAEMASRCNQVDIGARQIDHLLDVAILPQLSRRLLEQMGEEEMPTSVTMTLSDDKEFAYNFSRE